MAYLQTPLGELSAQQHQENARVFQATQAAALSQVRNSDGGIFLYHGTDMVSAMALWQGAPLEVAKALELQHLRSADPGFYLATNVLTAEHFAAVQGGNKSLDSAMLQYCITNRALLYPQHSGAFFRPIAGGQSFTPGYEFLVPPSSFGTFNSLRSAGQINVGPVD